jgi:hypothetical protein
MRRLVAAPLLTAIFAVGSPGALYAYSGGPTTCKGHMHLCQMERKSRKDMDPALCTIHYRDCMKTGIWMNMQGQPRKARKE